MFERITIEAARIDQQRTIAVASELGSHLPVKPTLRQRVAGRTHLKLVTARPAHTATGVSTRPLTAHAY